MSWPVAPVPVPPSRWSFPDTAEEIAASIRFDEVAAVGADMEPGTLLAAYRAGLFPMRVPKGVPGVAGAMGWWSPEWRGILPLEELCVSRSLRKSLRRFEIRLDTAFAEVMAACGDPSRSGGWIDDEFRAAYTRLHQLGWVHSVEAWDSDGLAGGLYGVGIGGFFAGESMFHRRTDASKVALVGLVEELRSQGAWLLDVQWATDHLMSLGVIEVHREFYHELLADALAVSAAS